MSNTIKSPRPQNQAFRLINAMNTNMLGEITDEVVPWEVNQQCHLMNAIFLQVVDHRVQDCERKSAAAVKSIILVNEDMIAL